MNSILTMVLGFTAVGLAAVAAYWFIGSILDIVSDPAAKAAQRARGLAVGDEVAPTEMQRVSLLLRLASASSRGVPYAISTALIPLIPVLDKKGTAADSVRIRRAGVSSVLTVNDMLRIRAWTAFVLGALLGLVGLGNGTGPALFYAAAGLLGGARLPGFSLARAATERVSEVTRSLPEMIDMVALASRAGMSFDQALAAYADRFDSSLAREFKVAIERWSVGAVTREEALDEVADSLDVAVVSRFVAAVTQSLKLGSPLAKVLEEQSAEARTAHRLALEDQIARAPVKMLGPMGGLILPAMLLLMIGPIVAQISG